MSPTPYDYIYLPHGDPVISGMAEAERQDKRPACDWPIIEKIADGGTRARKCGSEERVYEVTGQGKYTGRQRKTPICEKHLVDAVKSWNWNEAIPVDTMPKS